MFSFSASFWDSNSCFIPIKIVEELNVQCFLCLLLKSLDVLAEFANDICRSGLPFRARSKILVQI